MPPTGAPLAPADLPADGRPVLAWPVDAATGHERTARADQVLVLRLPGARGPAVAAFSALCTHAGCLVSAWLPERALLHCPCHGSSFDPARAGAVVDGPATRPLPTLPIAVRDGRLVVAGPFSAPPGGGTGRTD